MKFTKLNLVTRFCRFFLPSDHRVIKKGVSARESKRAVFIDLDGTLWPDMGPGSILKNPVIDMGVILRLNQLSNAGYLLIGITNQTYFGYRSELNPVSIFRYRYKLRRIVRDRVLDMIKSRMSETKTE
jgi:hypothetical protein